MTHRQSCVGASSLSGQFETAAGDVADAMLAGLPMSIEPSVRRETKPAVHWFARGPRPQCFATTKDWM